MSRVPGPAEEPGSAALSRLEAPEYAEEAKPDRLTGEKPATPVAPSYLDRFKIILEGEKADVYLTLLRRLISGGRTNQFYPNPRAQDNLYKLMAPAANFGLDNQIRLNHLNGLPSEPDIGRVLADKDACARFQQMNDNADILSRQDDASKRLHKRIAYYREVAKSELPRRVHMEMKLRTIDHVQKVAHFYTIFERYDPGEGIFTRYTIQLTHQHTRWNRQQIELQGDDLLATEAFRNVISRYHSDEAEFAFMLLCEVPSINVEEVVRARIGPLWFKESNSPPEIAALLESRPGDFILNFPLERVGIPSRENYNKEDLNNDPFARLYRSSIADGDARQIADRRAETLGYRVYKERKFCCTKGIAEPLKELLAQRGLRCVIYTI